MILQGICCLMLGMMFGLETFVGIIIAWRIKNLIRRNLSFGISGKIACYFSKSTYFIEANHARFFLVFYLIQSISSWDEMAKYDLPAMIDKVLETTNQERLFYIGHSMGTTTFMAMAATIPEMQEKIIQAHFLAPIGFLEHMKSPAKIFAPYADQLKV